MPTVLHSSLTGSDSHEPKGVSGANANEVYIANGAGSGTWAAHSPYGGWRFENIGGTTFTTPTSYTLMNVTSFNTGGLHDFSQNSAGRLTFSGSANRYINGSVDITYSHSVGSGQDVYFAIYKNGALLSQNGVSVEQVGTADSANFQRNTFNFDDVAATNDYYEVYLKCASGNVILHTASMLATGRPV